MTRKTVPFRQNSNAQPRQMAVGNFALTRPVVRLTRLLFSIVLLLALSLPIHVASTPTALAQSRKTVGHLHFENSNGARAGKLLLDIESISAPPKGSHYELWLQSPADKLLHLGKLPLVDGKISFSSAQRENLLEHYAMLLISLEPDGQDDDLLSSQVVLKFELAKGIFGPLQSFFAPNDSSRKGLLLGSVDQLQLVLDHSQLLRKSLASNDEPGARTHVEHMVNVLSGELGEWFRDWNEDDVPNNPGDGFGVIAYLGALEQKLAEITPAAANAKSTDSKAAVASQKLLEQALADVQQSQSDCLAAIDLLVRIFSQDSIEEIKLARYFEQAETLLNQINGRLISAYEVALPNVTYILYADQFLPFDQLPAPALPSISRAEVSPANSHAAHQHAPGAPTLLQPANPQPGLAWTNPVDGSDYVYVGGGKFTMGADKAQTTFTKERPAHGQEVGALWVKKTEVTNGEYGKCVSAGVCSMPNQEGWQASEQSDYAVSHVTWAQATTYAQWVGGRLPSEAEWEHTCRSNENRTYPWGEEEPSAKSADYNTFDGGVEVGSYPVGASADGVLDLSGNVAEWTSSLDKPYPYNAADGREDPTATGKRIARGGSFNYSQYQLRCFSRLYVAASSANGDVGFRVVIDPELRTWTNPVDGSEYVYVGGGKFTMGADKAQTTFTKERPAHGQEVGALWVKKTEVTNGEYGKCVSAGVCSMPNQEGWQASERSEYAVSHVTLAQATTYAQWAGGRLPNEAEWEHTCRSNENRTYPWGEEEPSAKSADYNTFDGGVEVGSYPVGASADGVLDLSGNVAEWTSSLDKPYPYNAADGREDPTATGKRIARGGSFNYSQYQLRCFSRLYVAASSANEDLGFRVVIDPGVEK